MRIPELMVLAQQWMLRVDGSRPEGLAGWGVAARARKVVHHEDALFALSRPVISDPLLHLFEGAVGSTSNAAETTANI